MRPSWLYFDTVQERVCCDTAIPLQCAGEIGFCARSTGTLNVCDGHCSDRYTAVRIGDYPLIFVVSYINKQAAGLRIRTDNVTKVNTFFFSGINYARSHFKIGPDFTWECAQILEKCDRSNKNAIVQRTELGLCHNEGGQYDGHHNTSQIASLLPWQTIPKDHSPSNVVNRCQPSETSFPD